MTGLDGSEGPVETQNQQLSDEIKGIQGRPREIGIKVRESFIR